MGFRRGFRNILCSCLAIVLAGTALRAPAAAQSSAQSSSSSSSLSSQVKKSASGAGSPLDSGVVSAGVYRNPAFGFTCKIPAGWVLRTEEMNTRDDEDTSGQPAKGATRQPGRVLLAAFSRPPEAKAEDVNGSILIAAESAAEYPGLTEAPQYFGPVVEAAKAQGLEIDDDPYQFVIGTRKLVRGDFQKDVGTRVMLQSTLVMLGRGYVVSFTFIGGTEDEVEELIQGLTFAAATKPAR
ncbi:MAG: hypothetical protein ACYDDS_11480 [Candidatus Sulfotelmatobacter sp.]